MIVAAFPDNVLKAEAAIFRKHLQLELKELRNALCALQALQQQHIFAERRENLNESICLRVFAQNPILGSSCYSLFFLLIQWELS